MFPLEQAILDTVAYADVFQYPLTNEEIHHYLIGMKASALEVFTTLHQMRLHSGSLDYLDGYYSLPGRGDLVNVRLERQLYAASLWPAALHYGKLISRLPFVRMVAITGSLAMQNANHMADLDYMIVTSPGRLWLTRAMVISIVRWARMGSFVLCPNYFLSENQLALQDQNLFTAHELVQMIPLSGDEVYDRLRRLNTWVQDYLPNASGVWRQNPCSGQGPTSIQRLGEALLQAPVFDRLERWEMQRKVRKFGNISGNHSETRFSADCCKGHFDDHETRVLNAFRERTKIPQEELL